jgi:hypothetical protein
VGWLDRNQKQVEDADLETDVEMFEAVKEQGREEEEADAGIKCSRCSKKGHFAAKCNAELYCMICDGHDHVNHRCPLLKLPRPVAHAVGYAVHGMGFYHIQHAPLARSKKDSKMALVTVEVGELSKEQVVAQLQKLFLGKWNWELLEHEGGTFIAKFPSKLEIQRAIAFGGANVREAGVPVGVRVKFHSWVEVKEGFLLPKVWVRVFGMRKELREFLELWDVGSLLGSTQTVDMETTQKNNFGRIMVAVLNPKLIPPHMDVVIGDHYFELEFEVEKLGTNENGEEVEVEWRKEGGGDGDYSGSPEKDEEELRDHKKLRTEGDVNGREAAVVVDKAPAPACLTGERTKVVCLSHGRKWSRECRWMNSTFF